MAPIESLPSTFVFITCIHPIMSGRSSISISHGISTTHVVNGLVAGVSLKDGGYCASHGWVQHEGLDIGVHLEEVLGQEIVADLLVVLAQAMQKYETFICTASICVLFNFNVLLKLRGIKMRFKIGKRCVPPPFQRKLFATPMIFGYLPQLFWVICHTLNDRVSENISDEKLTNQS